MNNIISDDTTKVCTGCGEEKKLLHFNNHKKGKYGKRSKCRDCQKKENQAYKQTEQGKEKRRQWKRSEKGRENEKRYRERNKDKIKEWQKRDKYKETKEKYRDQTRFGGNRQKALERDDHKCVSCGSKDKIQVHHKDQSGRNKPKEQQNNELSNLITLCAKCHINEHNPVLIRWEKQKG